MLRKEQNELLTQTGAGTAVGQLFRAYWLPALLVEELPENDCPPVRVKLLSERLLAFRDSDGRYGLIDEFCAHRGVSLWFARNEQSGLRCAYIGARRNAENGNYYWRITPWVMPCFTMIPPRGDHPIHGHFWIPIDDENCWAWSYDFHPVRALTRREIDAMRDGAGVHCKYVPGTYRPLANKDNDYLIDRAAQKLGKTFSGVAGFASQDAALQGSMGPICDRTKENLVSTANGIIMARHRLMRAAKALVEKGITPPGVDPSHHRVRSASVVLPPDQAFKDAAKEALTSRPGVAQTTV